MVVACPKCKGCRFAWQRLEGGDPVLEPCPTCMGKGLVRLPGKKKLCCRPSTKETEASHVRGSYEKPV